MVRVLVLLKAAYKMDIIIIIIIITTITCALKPRKFINIRLIELK
jgi:hypothetical protein